MLDVDVDATTIPGLTLLFMFIMYCHPARKEHAIAEPRVLHTSLPNYKCDYRMPLLVNVKLRTWEWLKLNYNIKNKNGTCFAAKISCSIYADKPRLHSGYLASFCNLSLSFDGCDGRLVRTGCCFVSICCSWRRYTRPLGWRTKNKL